MLWNWVCLFDWYYSVVHLCLQLTNCDSLMLWFVQELWVKPSKFTTNSTFICWCWRTSNWSGTLNYYLLDNSLSCHPSLTNQKIRRVGSIFFKYVHLFNFSKNINCYVLSYSERLYEYIIDCRCFWHHVHYILHYINLVCIHFFNINLHPYSPFNQAIMLGISPVVPNFCISVERIILNKILKFPTCKVCEFFVWGVFEGVILDNLVNNSKTMIFLRDPRFITNEAH